MALTKEQIQARIATKLRARHAAAIVWSDIATAVGGAGTQAKNDIVDAVKRGDAKMIGQRVLGLVAAAVNAKADAEAATMLADDSLSLAELERLL